ncbi:MAG: 50S ribosomal protein L32 [Candidatus Levybacteria bacterium]|nr:50S ribosomal protein L32 [Candidatus Levybacteria bacterium]
MPQEPKKRHSRQRKGKRRASIKLKKLSFVLCQNCKSVMLPHIVCKKCGFYAGQKVLTINTTKVVRKEGQEKIA